MYIPNYSLVEDPALIKKVIMDHGFGTLVTNSDEEIEANHYPFLLKEVGEGFKLYTHLALGNNQWKRIHEKPCLIIFTGPHAYISPTYYKQQLNVPTWNYITVHLKCQAREIKDHEFSCEVMKDFVSFFEKQNGTNWDYKLPEDFHQRLIKSIVWIEFEVLHVQAKFKLSQNRSDVDFIGVIDALSKDDTKHELVNYMKLAKTEKKL